MRNINKVGYRFRFEVRIESVDKITTSSDVCVTWERGAKVMSTKPAKVDPSTRTAHFGGEALNQDVTLFKKKKEGASFEDKVFRLTLRQANERGKIVGKIEINFAEYVEIPSYSKRIGASLSSNGRIVMRVSSTFLGEAKVRKGSRGSASISSSAFDADSDAHSSSGLGDDRSELDTDLNDLDDLDVEHAMPRPTPLPAPPVKKPQPQRRPLHTTSASDDVNQQRLPRRRLSGQSPQLDAPPRRELRDTAAVPQNSRSTRGRVDTDVGSTNGPAPSRAEFEKLKRENRGLRRNNDDLLLRNQDLENRLDVKAEQDGGAESTEQLMMENSSLRRDCDELEAKLAREPVYADVVRELREAKMALAILTLEKDELIQEVRKLRRRL